MLPRLGLRLGWPDKGHHRSHQKKRECGAQERGLFFSIEGHQCREKQIDGHIQLEQFTFNGYFQRKIKNIPI